jgi:hypothetical protein
MCYGNIHLSSKPPVTIVSVFPGTIEFLTRPIINFGCSSCILITNQDYALHVILLMSPGQSILLPWAHAKYTACRTNIHCTMATSQNIRKGVRSGRNTGPDPQRLTLVNEDPEVRASFE